MIEISTAPVTVKVHSSLPSSFRLAITDDGLMLQGMMEWEERSVIDGQVVSCGGFDWQTLETVDLRTKSPTPG